MKKVLGIGNALVDIMTILEEEEILSRFNLQKGSMQLVDSDFSALVIDHTKHLKKELSSGGSAANTIHGLANLGVPSSFIGKTGGDSYGLFFADDMVKTGIVPLLFKGSAGTGCAIALISPDSERTFATHLGAAIELSAEDLNPEHFHGFDYVYIEGYLVQNRQLIETAVKIAKEHHVKVCLDLASFNVVEQNIEFLKEIVLGYVDIVFANEEEAKAFTGQAPEEAIHIIAEMCDIAVVKTGAKGSLIKQGGKLHRISPIKCSPSDTTGAGDAYSAGFLYGLALGLPLDKCGAIGSLLSGRVIEVIGAKMNETTWKQIKADIESIVS
jgi:sugar/nucleoside kinase (ribokinase family)